MPDSKKLTLEDIATLAGQSRRNARYYIQEGLVDRPDGIGKGATYTQRHVEQLVQVGRMREKGLSLKGISDAVKRAADPVPPPALRPGTVEVRTHLVVDHGVEVVLDPERARLTPEEVRAFFRAVTRAYQEINPRDSREPITDKEKNK